MPDELHFMEASRREISRLAGQTLKLLKSAGPNESPCQYQAAIRNVTALVEIWATHIRKLNAVFPLVMSSDLPFAKSFDRMTDGNTAVACMLARLPSSDWPRSSPSGLNSIRSSVTETLILVLHQLELEEAMLAMGSRQQERTSMTAPNPAAPFDHLAI